MSSSQQVVGAIRELSDKLAELSLPEKTDEVMVLVVQQQHLLETYIQTAQPNQIDQSLIRDVMSENTRLIGKTRRAHSEAADELDALAMGRSAVSAYQGILPSQVARLSSG